ncbi:MAG: type IV toxin-antitoxin system AbiEi family antitoxin domain-containing protein [Acidimicrobiales bacterium]
MTDRRIPLLAARAERRHGLLTSEDLAAAGIDRREVQRWLRRGRLEVEGRGVFRIGGCPATTESRILAAILTAEVGSWASHLTAAWLHEQPGIGRPGRIEIMRLHSTSNQRTSACGTAPRTCPTTTPPSSGASRSPRSPARSSTSPVLGERGLDRAVEAAIRTSACTIGALHRVVEDLGGRGRPGTAAMRAVLLDRGRTYVPTESELDLLGRAVVAPIEGIEWQVELSDERGYIRRVDGLHRAAGLVIEWDGAEFHDRPDQRRLDAEGDERLRRLGLEVVRFGWADVTLRPAEVRRSVAERASPSAA